MSQWAREHPEEYEEIAALPPSQQNEALKAAIGYDPDRIRDEAKERRSAVERRCVGCRITPHDAYENGQPLCKRGRPHEFRYVRAGDKQ